MRRSRIPTSEGSSYFSCSYCYITCRRSQRKPRHPGFPRAIARFKWSLHSKVMLYSGSLIRSCGRTKSSDRRLLLVECSRTQLLGCLSGNAIGCAGRATSVPHSTESRSRTLRWRREHARRGRQCAQSRKNGRIRWAQYLSRRFGRWDIETWLISRTQSSAYAGGVIC
jgi:hypothetical protein